MLTKRDLLLRSAALAAITAATMKSAPVSAQTDVSPTEARAIAKEAYIYGFPIVDNYRIQHAYWVDRTNPEYKGGFNQVWNASRLFSPADTAIQTPNSDTLYSMIGADLRAEPLVLTVPAMKRTAISQSSSSITTPSISTTPALVRPATGVAPSCSLGRAGKARPPRASIRSFARRPNWHSLRIAPSSSTLVTSKM